MPGFFVPSTNERTVSMALKLIANYSKRLGLPGYHRRGCQPHPHTGRRKRGKIG